MEEMRRKEKEEKIRKEEEERRRLERMNLLKCEIEELER